MAADEGGAVPPVDIALPLLKLLATVSFQFLWQRFIMRDIVSDFGVLQRTDCSSDQFRGETERERELNPPWMSLARAIELRYLWRRREGSDLVRGGGDEVGGGRLRDLKSY